MVEGNENNTNEPDSGSSTQKRRGGLFGARRGGRGRGGQERPALTGDAPVDAADVTGAESGRSAEADPTTAEPTRGGHGRRRDAAETECHRGSGAAEASDADAPSRGRARGRAAVARSPRRSRRPR